MAKSPSNVGGGLSQLTIRITAEQLRYLQSPECGPGNPNELIRRLIEDARTFLGLPAPLVDRLASDAQQMGLDLSRYEERRDYLARLCAFRYEQLLTGQVPPPDRPTPPTKTKGKF
ncbi:MAG TPA: hypothetical protein VK447_21645 [Myxococcaceae bacterium]|nr:hypothetical protein [Myxococcaceae bacterium]